jgi:hypothetical protein
MSVFQIVGIIVVFAAMVVLMLAFALSEMEHTLILKQNVIETKKQYDAAWDRFEVAADQADLARGTEKEAEARGRRLRAHDDYLYWQKIFRRYQSTASKAGINIPGIC